MTKKKRQEESRKILIEKYGGQKVLVDVQPWLADTHYSKTVPITGPYRLGFHLVSDYWPAILVDGEEDVFSEAREKLERVLGKEILVLTPFGVRDREIKAWISLSLDYFCPHLTSSALFAVKKIAILNDIMPSLGIFGPRSTENYFKGIAYSNALLCVSKTTEALFRDIEKYTFTGLVPRTILRFPNCHRFGEFKDGLIDLDIRVQGTSLSLHTIRPYKNIWRTIELSNYYLCRHIHVGAYRDENYEKWQSLVSNSKLYHSNSRIFDWYFNVQDSVIEQLMFTRTHFICSSLDEGFSMPPMEAILLGVPHIILSDIPVHREIYGDFNVNFVSPKMGDLSFPTKPKQVTEEDRKEIFKRHTYENMTAALKEYVQSL